MCGHTCRRLRCALFSGHHCAARLLAFEVVSHPKLYGYLLVHGLFTRVQSLIVLAGCVYATFEAWITMPITGIM